MRLKEDSYRFAAAVLRDPQFEEAANEIRSVFRDLQPSLYATDETKIRHRKRGLAQAFPVNQKELNRLIDAEMPTDWSRQPLVVSKETAANGPSTNIKADFKKARIQLEVQFGNMARWYTDVFKFQLAYALDNIDVGVLVVPTQRFANLIDENLASYERVTRELPWAKMSLTLPILVIGIEPDDYVLVKSRYTEALDLYLSRVDRSLPKYKDHQWKARSFNEAIEDEGLEIESE